MKRQRHEPEVTASFTSGARASGGAKDRPPPPCLDPRRCLRVQTGERPAVRGGANARRHGPGSEGEVGRKVPETADA